MDEDDPDFLIFNYTRLMMAVLLFMPNPAHLCCIGLGGGSIPKYCHRYLPQTRISVAEINPQVIALREEFRVPRDSSRFGVFRIDGAEFVAANSGAFDVLMVDAFDLHGQPLHLCSVEFYRACYEALTPDGYLVVNLCHEGKAGAISRIEHVFNRSVYCLRDCDGLNLIAIAGKEEGGGAFLHSLPGRARILELTHPLFFREMAHSLLAGPKARIIPRGTL